MFEVWNVSVPSSALYISIWQTPVVICAKNWHDTIKHDGCSDFIHTHFSEMWLYVDQMIYCTEKLLKMRRNFLPGYIVVGSSVKWVHILHSCPTLPPKKSRQRTWGPQVASFHNVHCYCKCCMEGECPRITASYWTVRFLVINGAALSTIIELFYVH